jgi:cholinesterase
VGYWTYAYTQDPIVNGVIAISGNAFSCPVHGSGVAERNWNLIVQAVGCAEAADSLACMREADWKKLRDATGSVPTTGGSSVPLSTPPFYPSPDYDVVFPDYPSRARAGNFARIPALIGNTDDEDGYYQLAAYRNGTIASRSPV